MVQQTANSVVTDVAVLREARRLIRTKQRYRICYALRAAGVNLNARAQAGDLAVWVMEMLGDESFYEDWLIKFHPEFARKKRITSFDHETKLRPGRLAWLDWMIAECEKAEQNVKG